MLRYRVQAWNPYAVPRFEPFAAIRYAADDLASVIAPPYDVLSDADVDAFEARSIHNIVRIDVPRGGRPLDLAAETSVLGSLRESLSPTRTPRSHLPHRFTDSAGTRRDIAGVLGGLEVVDLEAAECSTRADPAEASTDRLDRLGRPGPTCPGLGAFAVR